MTERTSKPGRPRGFKCSDETKEKIRVARTGTTLSDETKQRISDSTKGVTKSISLARVLAVDLSEAKTLACPRGYVNVYIPQLDGTRVGTWMRLHVAVMEQKLGRKLEGRGQEDVHHMNEDKSDNREANLMLMTRKDHKAYHQFLKDIAKAVEEDPDISKEGSWEIAFKKRIKD